MRLRHDFFDSLEPRRLLAVHFIIDPTQNVHPISRFIYGINQSFAGGYANATLTRLGGNRWTAYNWENNASNAGSDYLYQNDGYLSASNVPGAAISPTLADAAAHNAGALVTVPMAGYVSADKNGGGDVRYNGNTWNGVTWVDGTPNPNYLSQRFKQMLPTKGSPFSLNPDTTDNFVYADEFVNWVKTNYPYGQTDPNKPIWFDLDNEPDIWSSTHAEIHPDGTTYSELINDSIDYATAIKNVEPNTLVFGGVNYGWNGYTQLQGATQDPSIKDTILNFQASFLKAMHAADQTAGKRLVDVLDMHWYPEATGVNASGTATRIINNDNSPGVVQARIQAPRSLWDPSYTYNAADPTKGENSWITRDSLPGNPPGTPAQFKNTAIQLIPREMSIINEYDPGMKMSISEYNYGGGTNISGAIAEADVLGIFGKQGIFSADEWPMLGSEPFIAGGMNMFRNYDGANSTFGDTSISATTDDSVNSSVYASVDSAHPGALTIVAINKNSGSMDAMIDLKKLLPQGSTASVYRMTSANSTPQFAGTINIADPSNFTYTMPGMSVSTIRIQIAAPTVVAASPTYVYQTAPNKISFAFTEDVSATLAASDVTVTRTGGSSVTATLQNYDSTTNAATFTLPTPLANGEYTVTINHTGVTNAAFQTLPSNFTFNFFSLAGDANHDGAVNALDFNALATNYGKSGASYSDGDFNLNGTVDTADFTMLAGSFGTTVSSASTLLSARPSSPLPEANLPPLIDLIDLGESDQVLQNL